MDDMALAYINGKILTWARKRVGYDIERLVGGKITVAKVIAWESGESYPSEGDAEALAEKLGISYAMLFMKAPPATALPTTPDLRTLSGKPIEKPSVDFLRVLTDTLARQEWCRGDRLDAGAKPLPFVGKFTLADRPSVVAAAMTSVLDLDLSHRSSCNSYEDFLKSLVKMAEQAGILVMRSGVVRHATNRPLNVNEFRGFVLNDSYAPIVFINDTDAKAAQVFTLAHELAHIWIGADGVSDRHPNTKKDSRNAIEVFCDKVAAEFLIPEAAFPSHWRAGTSDEQNMRETARFFKVSTLSALRRAKDLGRLPLPKFFQLVDEQYDHFKRLATQEREKQKRRERKGGNFWASFDLRNSPTFNKALAASLKQERISYSDAASLFGVNISATVTYLRRLGTAAK